MTAASAASRRSLGTLQPEYFPQGVFCAEKHVDHRFSQQADIGHVVHIRLGEKRSHIYGPPANVEVLRRDPR